MKNILLMSLLISGYNLAAQSIERQVIGCAGGTATVGSVIVTSTVGEVAVETLSGTLILTQGYQQASTQPVSVKEISVKAIFSIYPNPTTNNSILEITAENTNTSTTVELYSPNGKLISSQEIDLVAGSKSTTTLNLSSQAAGVYYIKIRDSQAKLSKTIRLIKQ